MGLAPVSAVNSSATMKGMSLRREIETYAAELDGRVWPPSNKVADRLRSILAASAPRVLTTLEELDSQEAARALCLVPADGSGIVALYQRENGVNTWAGIGSEYFCSSAQLLEDFAGTEPRFTVVPEPDPLTAPFTVIAGA